MQTFQITVDSNVLEKAKHFFNSGLNHILNELLQNARRAKASCIWIRTYIEDGMRFCSIMDDGEGIFKEDVRIALGGSDWDSEIQESENPAGCGLFSLANRGCQIKANGKRVNITSEAFTGKIPVAIEETGFSNGTRIDFAITQEEAESLAETVTKATKYYPLPVYYQRNKVKRGDFLQGALFIKEWSGLRIGVVEETYCWHDGEINFHGLTVEQNFPHILLSKAREIYRVKYLTTRIEVIDCPELKLVLPAQKEVVQNEFLAQLQVECERTIYEYIRTLYAHRLPFQSWEKAKTLGVDLPEAEPKLYTWVPYCLDNYSGCNGELVDVNDRCLLVDVTDETYDLADYHVFDHAWKQSGNGILLEPDPDYAGYSWYQSLTKIVDFSVIVQVGDEKEPLERCMGSTKFQRPDDIRIIYFTLDKEGDKEPIANKLSTDIAFISELDDGFWEGIENITLLVTKDSETSTETLNRLLMDTYFTTSECTDEFGYEMQREMFSSEINQLINLVIHDEDYANRQKIAELAQKFLAWETPHGKTTQITIKPDGNIDVTFID
ncbi:ATP-binding protein [Cyanothece sp. BG0011]|uniref:ATP-binding protein n=1 Tax=Cyanothece sp. BG0011 TaxID=2082950 RepID=UPI000D1D6262|nr:ATP-binding protein [Cyanothece sp. BG0011]